MNIITAGNSATFTLLANNLLTVESFGGTTVTGPSGLLGTVDGTSTFNFSVDTLITIAAVGQECTYGVTEPVNVTWNPARTGFTDPVTGRLRLGTTVLSVVMIGGDHPYDLWSGAANNGVDKLYSDRGIKPYLAINTAPGIAAPGDPGYETWAQLKTLKAEILAHGHRHPQDWTRTNSGVQITYSGAAASATVQITGTPKTLTLVGNGGAENTSFDLTNASYDTLAELAAAISATPSWTCTVAPELTGSEKSINLLNVATARNVKAVTTPANANTYFSACGGIAIAYGGNGQAAVQITSGILYVFINGIARGIFNLSNASYDTLTELVTQINSTLGAAGIKAALCNDGAVSGQSTFYLVGDEASTSLGDVQWLEITRSGYTLGMTDSTITYGQRVNAGLPHSYLIERLIEACIDTAAANGIAIEDFAQAGTGMAQWLLSSTTRAKSYRMDKPDWGVFPSPTWAAIGDPSVYSHYAIDTTISKEAVMAAIDAAEDSPGCIVNILAHALTPAVPSGKNGYVFNDTTSAHKFAEDDFITCMDHLKAKIDGGTVIQMTPKELRAYRRSIPRPQNYIFNPKLRNSGVALLGKANGFDVPGWQLTANGANLTAIAIANGVLTQTTNSDVAVGSLAQPLMLERGKTYRAGCRVDVVSKTSGLGVRLKLDPRYSGMPNALANASSANSFWSSAYAQSNFTDIEFQFTVPNRKASPAQIIGSAAGTFNITAATNDTLTVTIDSLSFTATLTAGAARTASQVAADINAAIAADADFLSKQEYWNIASAVGNNVVLTAPNVAKEFWSKITVSGNAAATVLGASVVTALPNYAGATDAFAVPPQLTLSQEMTGTVNVSGFFVRELDPQN